jgi:hypothetical protein|tara:strand:- start:536 stop:904 length:369 start_codon:yes stop_codon:yes gene_type:complete
MTIFIIAISWSTKRAFESIGVLNVKFFPDNHSSSRFFAFMYAKHATMKTEIIAIFIEDPRKSFLFRGQALQAQVGDAIANDTTRNESAFGCFGALRILNDGVRIQRSLGVWAILLSRTAIYE